MSSCASAVVVVVSYYEREEIASSIGMRLWVFVDCERWRLMHLGQRGSEHLGFMQKF